jgi:hypothetical protein
MSNENQNNAPRWRNKLDELEHLAGSTFNGDAAWDKLYGRLRGKKKSKKIFWYWIAAACLLLVSMIALLNQGKNISQPVNNETAIKQEKETDGPVVKVDEADKNKSSIELIKKKIVSTSKQVHQNRRTVLPEIATKAQSTDVVTNYSEQGPIAKPLQIIGANSTIAAVPPKKKLNVVHINELGDPVIGFPDMVRNSNTHSFQLKLASGEVLANPVVIPGANSFTSLKIKPASN